MRLKAWHGNLLLILFVLAAYYPSLHAGYNSVDDQNMINRLINAGPIDLYKHFFPQRGGVYYRPLTTLTYYFDRDAWGTIASFMHLENILIHLGNAFLVLILTRRLLKQYVAEIEGIALFSALLFALHPLTTESVCWISGRTDLLAGLFLLIAFWLLLVSLQNEIFWPALCSAVALLVACLAKEIAVFVLPGFLWFAVIFPQPELPLIRRLKERWYALLMPIVAVVGYFVMRNIAIVRDTGINKALAGASVSGGYELLDKIRIVFKVYGFYFKKLFVPWPLNFGIVEVSGWYVLSGIVLALLLIWFLFRADILGALGLLAFCALSPAILIPFSKMTWTPIAERYLYVSIAFFAPMVALFILWLCNHFTSVSLRQGRYVLVIVLLIFFTTTLHRSWIWQDNSRLYADTVKKSPNFLPAKSELASALIRKGNNVEAEAILTSMQKSSTPNDFLNDDINLAQTLMAKGDLEVARSLLIDHLDKKGKKYHTVLQTLLKINNQRLARTNNQQTQTLIQRESLSWLLEQQRIRPDAFTLYRIAKIQQALGDQESALEFYSQAYNRSAVDTHYHAAAGKQADRLRRELNRKSQ